MNIQTKTCCFLSHFCITFVSPSPAFPLIHLRSEQIGVCLPHNPPQIFYHIIFLCFLAIPPQSFNTSTFFNFGLHKHQIIYIVFSLDDAGRTGNVPGSYNFLWHLQSCTSCIIFVFTFIGIKGYVRMILGQNRPLPPSFRCPFDISIKGSSHMYTGEPLHYYHRNSPGTSYGWPCP